MKPLVGIIALIAISVALSSGAVGQQYWSKRYSFDPASPWSFSENIIPEPFGYTLALEEGQPWNPDHRRIGFLRLDPDGNQLDFCKVYQDSVWIFNSRKPGSFLKVQSNSGYAMVLFISKWVPEGRWDVGWLMRLDGNLDTLWTRTYPDAPPHDSSVALQNFRELTDGGFIIAAGYAAVAGGEFWRIRLMCTDSLGNLIWSKYFGSGNTDFLAFDVTPTSDGGFAVSANKMPYPYTQDNDLIVIKTDSVGNKQWEKQLGNPLCDEDQAFIDTAADGNMMVGTTWSDSCDQYGDYFSRVNLVKLRNDGSVVWDLKYGIAEHWRILNKVKVMNDGCVVAVGKYFLGGINDPNTISWILKTDSSGNEQWYREYILVTGDYGENNLYNVVQAADGGFAACGTVFPVSLPDTGNQDSWLLKVDSLGCESPTQCWVGEDEIRVKHFTPECPFVVYPNPAEDRFFVEFHENPHGAAASLFTMAGREVSRAEIALGKKLMQFECATLPPGLYILRVTLPGRTPASLKVVVE